MTTTDVDFDLRQPIAQNRKKTDSRRSKTLAGSWVAAHKETRAKNILNAKAKKRFPIMTDNFQRERTRQLGQAGRCLLSWQAINCLLKSKVLI